MVFETEGLSLLQEALEAMGQGFQTLPEVGNALDSDGVRSILLSVAGRMQENYPYFHPLYVGQMLKPPHPVARLAYALAMFINPNNHALDGGRASSEMEKEAVAQIAAMFGWSSSLGHLTSGGTMANFEALWIARELAPGKAVAASAQRTTPTRDSPRYWGCPFAKLPRTNEVGWILAISANSCKQVRSAPWWPLWGPRPQERSTRYRKFWNCATNFRSVSTWIPLTGVTLLSRATWVPTLGPPTMR